MTIDDVLNIADPNGVFSYTMRNQLRDAILALLDAEAEACAALCESQYPEGIGADRRMEQCFDSGIDCAIGIRARIAARKGGA